MKIKISTIAAIIILITLNTQSQNSDHAPDQVDRHAASKKWFVSNLEGGIALKKNGHAWIIRTNELKKWAHYRKDKKAKT